MERFHLVDDGAVILRLKGGTYRQVKMYRRGGRLYAGHGTGYVRLYEGGGTSCPNIAWIDAEVPQGERATIGGFTSGQDPKLSVAA